MEDSEPDSLKFWLIIMVIWFVVVLLTGGC